MCGSMTFTRGDHDFAAGLCGSCEVEDHWRLTHARPSEGKRIGPKEFLGTTCGRHGWHICRAGQRGEARFGQRLDFDPERREVMDPNKSEHRNPLRLGQVDQRIATGLQGERSKPAVRIDPQGTGRDLLDLRSRRPIDLAAIKCGNVARQANEPVARAAVAFGRRNGFRDGIRIVRVAPVGDQTVTGQLMNVVHGEGRFAHPPAPLPKACALVAQVASVAQGAVRLCRALERVAI